MGEFEASLIQFERAWRIRKEPKIKIGMTQCKDAILHTTAKKFDKDLIAKLIKSQQKPVKEQKTGKTQQQQSPEKKNKIKLDLKEKVKKEKIQKLQDKVLLGKVATDASFLRCFTQPDSADGDSNPSSPELVICASNIHSNYGLLILYSFYIQRRALEIATEALKYLEKRKTFWQQTGS